LSVHRYALRAGEAGERRHGLGVGVCRQPYHPIVATVGDEDGAGTAATNADGDIGGVSQAGERQHDG
jgi:hypothetical protein